MAKVKQFAVEVQVVSTVTVYVDARRHWGAVDKVQTPEGWAEARRHDYEDELPMYWDPKTMTVLGAREAGT